MTTGLTRWADISSLANNIQQDSLAVLRVEDVFVRTVTVFTDTMGMNPRKLYQLGESNVRQVAEGEDVAPTYYDKDELATLTPATYADSFVLTDQRLRSDWDNVSAQAANELGAAFRDDIDTNIAANFTSLNGGTVGSYLGTVTWSNVIAAKAKLRQRKVPGPYFCALGEGQWYFLVNNGGSVYTAFDKAELFNDALIDNYYITKSLGGVIFVISANVPGGAGGSCTGAMYSPLAIAYDERKAFGIEPERDASKRSWEINASMDYATGTWDAGRGIQLRGTDVIA
jgi:hypothetical protein